MAKDNRLFVNALVWIMRTGAAWADLLERFGKPNSVGKRFRRLARNGVWQRVHAALQEPDTGSCSIRPSCGLTNMRRAKKSAAPAECLGRSRGGMSTKIHVCTDALGNALRLLATPGQAGDCPRRWHFWRGWKRKWSLPTPSMTATKTGNIARNAP